MNSTINCPPNPKFDRVYVVMRYDPYITGDPVQAISALKVFLNESEANAEAERLNQLIRNRLGCRFQDVETSEYYVMFARIKKGLLKNDEDKI